MDHWAKMDMAILRWNLPLTDPLKTLKITTLFYSKPSYSLVVRVSIGKVMFWKTFVSKDIIFYLVCMKRNIERNSSVQYFVVIYITLSSLLISNYIFIYNLLDYITYYPIYHIYIYIYIYIYVYIYICYISYNIRIYNIYYI